MFSIEDDHDKYKRRREVVFILLAGLFLGTLSVMNILGISRQIDLSFVVFGAKIPMIVFIGVLPYPITFLCTDLISELYGKRRANLVVWTGLMLNVWIIFLLWIGGVLPPHEELVNGLPAVGADGPNPTWAFFQIRKLSFGSTMASMLAYITAQFVDVQIFHFLKKLTKGKAMWVRNNFSTLVSQLIDSLAVVSITWLFMPEAISIGAGSTVVGTLAILILSNYFFKMISAFLDTLPFYQGTKHLSRYLNIDNLKGYK